MPVRCPNYGHRTAEDEDPEHRPKGVARKPLESKIYSIHGVPSAMISGQREPVHVCR